MERTSVSRDDTNHIMLENIDVFDDDFAVDDFDVADGFAPRRSSAASSRHRRSLDEPPIRSIAAHMAEGPILSSGPSRANRNSTRKSRRFEPLENPFRSAEDDDTDSLDRTFTQTTHTDAPLALGMAHRTISSASSSAFARTHSPLQGDGGPSHPYTMYPQGTTIGRMSSTSTTSTIRPVAGAPLLPQQPAHPYGMYPQNVADDDMDDDDELDHPQDGIPVGYPGLTPNYATRRLPRDDHDNISISAHSEQLPPYSEYPEDGAPKNIVLPQQTPSGQSSSTLGGQQVQTAFAHRAPQSMSDNTPLSTSSTLTAGQGSPLNEPTSADVTPKSWSEKSWKEKRKTKFCGVPFGWILLSFGVVTFVVVVVTTVIAGFVDSHRQHSQAWRDAHATTTASAAAAEESQPTNTLVDAAPLSTTSAFPVPTGQYSLQLDSPTQVQNACLTNSSQSAAWACQISGGQDVAISIGPPPNGGSTGAYVYGTGNSNIISYGMNPPNTILSSLQLVQDLDEPQLGPAYQFQVFYNKLVVAPASAFNAASSSKRDMHGGPHTLGDWFMRHQVAAGDQPWFCYWNNTLLEGFIYIQDNSTMANATTTSPSWSASAGSSSAILASATSTSAAHKRVIRQADSDDVLALQLYPYVIKLEERRIPGAPQPYCQQYQMLDDGSVGALDNGSSGEPIIVQLSESDPGLAAYSSAGLKQRSTEVAGGCHCQWFSGSGS